MKSIQNQYNQLIEGNISQANFMRNIRMTFPQYITNVTNFDDSVKILKNKGLLSEAKATNTDHLCNPVEVDLGLKVEVSKHDGDVEKAKKTVYANLKKNSSYYSQLNLGGQAVEPEKIKVKKSKKKHSDIDTENGMKKVKEVVKENLDETGLNLAPNEQPNEAVKQAAQFIDLNNQLKQFAGDITLQNHDEDAVLKFGYWEKMPEGVYEKLSIQFDIEEDADEDEDTGMKIAYILTPKPSQFRTGERDLGAAFEKFKATLETIVREVLEEENQLNEGYYDDIAGYTSVSDNGTGFKDNDKVKSKSGQEGVVYDVLKSKEGKALVVVKFQNNGNTTISKYGEGFNDINDISK
jgi:hypothetical protein